MNKNIKIIFIFSLIGTLFSGYLTFSKLFTGSCPLTEGCPYFLGYPACYYGFILFTLLLILSILLFKKENINLMKKIYYISLIGILFSLYSSIKELLYPNCLNGICNYSFLIPTCIYGLIMYVLIFINSKIYIKRNE
jgi:uncharacterized membrane protein